MKNTSKIILTTFMLIGIVISPVSAAFPDVSSDHIYSDAIDYVKDEGIVDGFTDGTFGPEKTITRAEFTKIIVNTIFNLDHDATKLITSTWCFKEDEGGQYHLSLFDDVEPYWVKNDNTSVGNKFSKYTCIANREGIVSGFSDGTFKPNNPITVGEASKIISNAYGFTDLDSGPEGDVFEPFVDALAERNTIPTSIISIDSELKRGEMAEIIYRLEKMITNKKSISYSSIKFKDIRLEDSENYLGKYVEIKVPQISSVNINKIDDVVTSLDSQVNSNYYVLKIVVFEPGAGCMDLVNPIHIGTMKNLDKALYRVEEDGIYWYKTAHDPLSQGCSGYTASVFFEDGGAANISCEGNVDYCDESVRTIMFSEDILL